MPKLKLAEESTEPEVIPDNPERRAVTVHILAAETEIDRLEDEAGRCRSVVSAASDAVESVEVLRRHRAGLLAAAFVAGQPAAVADVDREIAQATQAREDAATAADDARVMLEVIGARIDEVKHDLEMHHEALKREAFQELGRLRGAAEQEYERLAEAMRGPVQMIYAVDWLSAALSGRPGQVVNRLRLMLLNEGLRTRSGFERQWAPPVWLRINSSPYDGPYSSLVAKLRTWGLKL